MGPPSLAMSASSRMSFRQGAGPNSTDHMLPHGPEGLRRDSGMSEGFQSPLASSSHYYNAQSFRLSAWHASEHMMVFAIAAPMQAVYCTCTCSTPGWTTD
jgi:hypothetical protein